MSRVSINERILNWALERSGSAGAVQRKFPKLNQWLRGESLPTLPQLEAFARATSTPLGFLFLPEPPIEKLPIPHFRTIGSEPSGKVSVDLLETIQRMQRRQDWMREYLIELGQEQLEFVNSAKISDSPERTSQKIKAILGLAAGWASRLPTWTEALQLLQRKTEDLGILLVVSGIVGNNTRRKLDPNEFRGFVIIDEYAPVVFLNGADGKAAQMFTLAHELAHVWFGSSASFDLRGMQPAKDRTEIACDRVAAEFLVPTSELRQLWPMISNISDRFQMVARQFKVSEIVAARRALDLELITKRHFFDFYEKYRAAERSAKGQSGGDFYLTQNRRLGLRFAEAVVRAVLESKLLYREAYRLTGLYGSTFQRYAESIMAGETL